MSNNNIKYAETCNILLTENTKKYRFENNEMFQAETQAFRQSLRNVGIIGIKSILIVDQEGIFQQRLGGYGKNCEDLEGKDLSDSFQLIMNFGGNGRNVVTKAYLIEHLDCYLSNRYEVSGTTSDKGEYIERGELVPVANPNESFLIVCQPKFKEQVVKIIIDLNSKCKFKVYEIESK